jgi:putative Mn2+ efflux pump MntP
MNESYPIWIGAIALVVLAGLIYIYKKFSEQDKKEHMPPEDRALEEKWIA